MYLDFQKFVCLHTNLFRCCWRVSHEKRQACEFRPSLRLDPYLRLALTCELANYPRRMRLSQINIPQSAYSVSMLRTAPLLRASIATTSYTMEDALLSLTFSHRDLHAYVLKSDRFVSLRGVSR
jgi:hypothetical protein